MIVRALLLVLSLVLVAGPAAGQEEAFPSASPGAEASASPPAEAPVDGAELGGTWRRTSTGPFGANGLPGGWDGTEVVVVDPQAKRRAAAYNPALDTWYDIARPPRKVRSGATTVWTGSELLFVEPVGAARRGLVAYDPVADSWRSTPPAPLDEIASSAWADPVLVVVSSTGAMASYDPALDTWLELPSVPLPEPEAVTSSPGPPGDEPSPAPAVDRISIHPTGEQLYALVVGKEVALVPFDLAGGAWGEPSRGPLAPVAAPPLWVGDAFVFLSFPEEREPTLDGPRLEDGAEPTVDTESIIDAEYDPDTGTWTSLENPCGIDTTDAIWADPLILAVDQGRALDRATGQCYTLPLSPWAERVDALRTWTGHELLQLSGTTGGKRAGRGGVAYGPFPDDDALGVAVDKPSRAVRIQVPSLGIDLPVISDKRRVAGSSPGYPACDVALSWSVFDRPGAPGTAWILAHAQEGMFLPLLDTLLAKGKAGLLGLQVELQLRDGRLFTYRTYRVNPGATDANIGVKGRKDGEHRLVLQTSTGIGSAPKLLVAARLVDVGTTDEPRPTPEPRACG